MLVSNSKKTMIISPILLLLIVGIGFLITSGHSLQSNSAEAAENNCGQIPRVSRVFFQRHILIENPSPELESKTIDRFIESMDPSKLYLLKSDVENMQKMLSGIFKKIDKRNCDPLAKANEIFVQRVKERRDFAIKTLESKDFRFNTDVSIQMNPDQREYAENRKSLDAFQSKHLQFQLSSHIATDKTEEEAKELVLRSYERVYARASEVKEADLYTRYLESFGKAFDAHSSYLSPQVYEDFRINMGLSLEGIGATLSSEDGFTTIEDLIDGGSAKDSGRLMPKDRIMEVGQFENGKVKEMESIVEMDLRDVVRKIRGPKGSKVRLLILRSDPEKGKVSFHVDLERRKIELKEQAASLIIEKQEINGREKTVGVINLPSFYSGEGRTSTNDVRRLLEEAKEKKVEALVLDLSRNGGGSLDDAVTIAGLFIRRGNIVKQSARNPRMNQTLAAKDPAVNWNGPLVILTSRLSASASEIVAGALRDYERAVIVGGDHTFGKGTVQAVEMLGVTIGAAKVTVGMFYTPGGNSTQHIGVPSDIVLPSIFSRKEIGEKELDRSLPESSVEPFLSDTAFVSEGQGAWMRISKEQIDLLRARSEERVDQDEDFLEIREEVAKTISQYGQLTNLAEVFEKTREKRRDEAAKADLSETEKEREYLERPDVREAIRVAADLADLQSGITLTVGEAKTREPKEAVPQ